MNSVKKIYWATSVTLKKLPKVNSRPKGDKLGHLVTLLWVHNGSVPTSPGFIGWKHRGNKFIYVLIFTPTGLDRVPEEN
jgi:hypothetical protein